MARRKQGRPVNGWLNLDKPSGMTSTHAVNVVKRLFGARKAGHAGTLDPLATGVLPIAFGEATKTMNFAVDGDKAYRFTVRWGAETTTDDSEGEFVRKGDGLPALPDVESAMGAFVGQISQVPPTFSAIKVDGQRAYDLARDGEEVTLQARNVVVHDLKIIDMPDDETTVFEARCGKGTYVRAIARDLGRALGCLGHIIALRRTQVGPFTACAAVSLGEIEAIYAGAMDARGVAVPAQAPDAQTTQDQGDGDGGGEKDARAQAHARCDGLLQPVSAALAGLENIDVAANDAGRIRRGQSVLIRGRDAPVLRGQAYATARGELIALGEIEGGEFIPTRVFNL